MPNQIIPVVWEKPLRKSAVNTLDKLNEVIDFINTSDIHEFSFIDGDTGREVVSGTSTQLATLDVFGECVQDGTPTPDNPVPVQVVEGRNLLDGCDGETTGSFPFNHQYNTNPLQLPYTLKVGESVTFSFDVKNTVASQLGIVLIYADETSSSFYTFTNTLGRKSNTIVLPKDVIACGFYSSEPTLIVADFQLETGTQATPYTPYGCIGLQTGETITPIDLQGHTLASLQNDVRDHLTIDGAGVKAIGQRVKSLDLSTVSWQWQSAWACWYTDYYNDMDVVPSGATDQSYLFCDTVLGTNANNIMSSSYTGTGIAFTATESLGSRIVCKNGSTTDTPTGMFYYPLAIPVTHELGTITPPPIPSGSVIKIAASLQPEFDIQWWTESAIPSVINGLKAYVDAQIETVNARIDELHGISRATIARPDVVIPVLEPIVKSTVDETETDTEKEI